MRSSFLLVLLFLFLGFTGDASPMAFPAAIGRINDFSGVLQPSAIKALAKSVGEFEEATHHQIAVVTIPSLDGAAIEDYTRDLANLWGAGGVREIVKALSPPGAQVAAPVRATLDAKDFPQLVVILLGIGSIIGLSYHVGSVLRSRGRCVALAQEANKQIAKLNGLRASIRAEQLELARLSPSAHRMVEHRLAFFTDERIEAAARTAMTRRTFFLPQLSNLHWKLSVLIGQLRAGVEVLESSSGRCAKISRWRQETDRMKEDFLVWALTMPRFLSDARVSEHSRHLVTRAIAAIKDESDYANCEDDELMWAAVTARHEMAIDAAAAAEKNIAEATKAKANVGRLLECLPSEIEEMDAKTKESKSAQNHVLLARNLLRSAKNKYSSGVGLSDLELVVVFTLLTNGQIHLAAAAKTLSDISIAPLVLR